VIPISIYGNHARVLFAGEGMNLLSSSMNFLKIGPAMKEAWPSFLSLYIWGRHYHRQSPRVPMDCLLSISFERQKTKTQGGTERMKRILFVFITMVFALAALSLATGCGGSSSSSSTTTNQNTGSVSGSAN
jgi:hypothetical protein